LRWARGCRAVEVVVPSDPARAPSCVRCFGSAVKRDGRRAATGQRFRGRGCRRTFTARTGTPFAGYRWPLEVITTAVRWDVRYRVSAADGRGLLAERHLDVSARTGLAWAHTFGPSLAAEGRRHARRVGTTWYADATSVRMAGRWGYLDRAVDEDGQVVDVPLREHRDLESARAFFDQAIARRGVRPRAVVTDKHAAYRRAVRRRAWRAAPVRTGLHRARGATTKPIDRAHLPIKDRGRPTRGLQAIAAGQRRLEGSELAHAIRHGHLGASTVSDSAGRHRSPHERAREAADAVTWTRSAHCNFAASAAAPGGSCRSRRCRSA
jgi:transposase-like protein